MTENPFRLVQWAAAGYLAWGFAIIALMKYGPVLMDIWGGIVGA